MHVHILNADITNKNVQNVVSWENIFDRCKIWKNTMNHQKSYSTIFLLQSVKVMKFSVTDSNIQGKIHPALLFHLAPLTNVCCVLLCCIVSIVLKPLTVKVDSAFLCSLCVTVTFKSPQFTVESVVFWPLGGNTPNQNTTHDLLSAYKVVLRKCFWCVGRITGTVSKIRHKHNFP